MVMVVVLYTLAALYDGLHFTSHAGVKLSTSFKCLDVAAISRGKVC